MATLHTSTHPHDDGTHLFHHGDCGPPSVSLLQPSDGRPRELRDAAVGFRRRWVTLLSPCPSRVLRSGRYSTEEPFDYTAGYGYGYECCKYFSILGKARRVQERVSQSTSRLARAIPGTESMGKSRGNTLPRDIPLRSCAQGSHLETSQHPRRKVASDGRTDVFSLSAWPMMTSVNPAAQKFGAGK